MYIYKNSSYVLIFNDITFMLYNLYNVGQIKDLGGDACKPFKPGRME
jgi:hypothetical protein